MPIERARIKALPRGAQGGGEIAVPAEAREPWPEVVTVGPRIGEVDGDP